MSLSKETAKEVERLRKLVEELEIKAASAASMQKPSIPMANGFPSQAPSYGFGTVPTSRTTQNEGQPQSHGMVGGFSANVMGSGGVSIPTPSGTSDPYANPF
jgi:hypothetical protein